MAGPNLVTAPEDLSHVSWTNQFTVDTVNVANAPDGTLTADRVQPTAVLANSAYMGASVTVTVGQPHYFSAFHYTEQMDNLFFGLGGGPFAGEVAGLFDMSALAVIDSDDGSVATFEDGGVVDYGNGWYRCWLRSTPTASGALLRIGPTHATALRAGSDGYVAYTPNGTDGSLLWGVQAEITDLTNYTSVGGTEILVPSGLTAGLHINDALYAWASDQGGVGDHINDRLYSALVALGATAGNIDDMWLEYLIGAGYSGALTDMKGQFLTDEGYK